PAAPVRTSDRPGKSTLVCTNGAFVTGSDPEVVSVKLTLAVEIFALMMLCAKFTLNSVLPKKLLLAWPFESVGVVLPDKSEPPPEATVHVTVTPGCGWPWAFLTSTTIGACAAKFWAATCPSPETIEMVWAEATAPVIRETENTARSVVLENCIIASFLLRYWNQTAWDRTRGRNKYNTLGGQKVVKN